MHFMLKSGLFSKPKVLKAVDGVTFSIEKGRTMGLVGESGCGKTTVGRTILKLYQATAGRILYQGTDITGLSDSQMVPYRKKMQMIFQDPYTSLDPRKNIGDIIAEPIWAMKLCAAHQPPFCDLGNGHVSACWLHNESVKARMGEVKL